MSSPQRRYKILHAVGKGAFGTVYKAQLLGEGGFAKDVAIKLMDPNTEDAEDAAARQRDEARVLGLIRHRAILQVDGLVRLNGSWAVVMEYLDGVNLNELLNADPVPISCTLAICAEVSGALHVAHTAKKSDGTELNLVHRDIKPANLQLTRAGEVKVLDFGVARAEFGTRETETVGVILGTLRYMAPERLDGIDGPAGDIYALGVVFVELLTRRPFKKTSSSRERHEETVQLARQRIMEVTRSEVLVALAERLLSYTPEERPSAKELEAELWSISHEFPSPRLSDWSDDAVTKAQAQSKQQGGLEADELTDNVLMEQSASMMMQSGSIRIEPPEEAEQLPRRLVVAAALVAALFAVTCSGVAGLLSYAYFLERDPVAVVVEEPVVEVPEPAAEPAVEEIPDPTDEPEEEEPEEEVEPIEEVKEPEPAERGEAPPFPNQPEPEAPVQPAAPKPDPVAASMGKISVSGEVKSVVLKGKGGSFPPGNVPAGTYSAVVTFADGQTAKVEGLLVVRGSTTRLACEILFGNCMVR